jgi:hypothetical protein
VIQLLLIADRAQLGRRLWPVSGPLRCRSDRTQAAPWNVIRTSAIPHDLADQAGSEAARAWGGVGGHALLKRSEADQCNCRFAYRFRFHLL